MQPKPLFHRRYVWNMCTGYWNSNLKLSIFMHTKMWNYTITCPTAANLRIPFDRLVSSSLPTHRLKTARPTADYWEVDLSVNATSVWCLKPSLLVRIVWSRCSCSASLGYTSLQPCMVEMPKGHQYRDKSGSSENILKQACQSIWLW
jgi:hypothetical protein